MSPEADTCDPASGRRALRVLAIEPFYGGSHRSFLDGWRRTSRHHFDLLTFSDHHWKWRMRHGALSASIRARERIAEGHGWDVVWASDMLDLAGFLGLCPELASLPRVLYFHENQLTYPWRPHPDGIEQAGGGRDAHYAYTNFLSAAAADRIWFNSAFHRDEWLGALPGLLGRLPEPRHEELIEGLAARSEVQSPGVEIEEQDASAAAAFEAGDGGRAFELVWAARWEHDKNPEAFFDALRVWRNERPEQWRDADRPLRLHVLGRRHEQAPAVFAKARDELSEWIATWGFAERDVYRRLLGRADVFVSTARHEFFGISAVEAMAGGAHPVLPRRLSYPELVGGEDAALYEIGASETETLARRLASLCEAKGAGTLPSRRRWSQLVDRYRWSRRTADLDEALDRVARRTN